MTVLVSIRLPEPLVLPINYNHILQAVIYNGLSGHGGYSRFLHDEGYGNEKRQFKMFTFSLLDGKYQVKGKKIVFYDEVRFEVRSPEVFFVQTLANVWKKEGIRFGDRIYSELEVKIVDQSVEEEEIFIQMKTAICVYRTDPETKYTQFYAPDEMEFYQLLKDNFMRKYQACHGVIPEETIEIFPSEVRMKDKMVTKYKGTYLSGWKGIYCLRGKRKYLDFLYQTGLGSKNSQGFGMFDIL